MLNGALNRRGRPSVKNSVLHSNTPKDRCIYTVSQKKLNHFSLEHDFGTYCLILIILSLLQTEINCDQVYSKIYYRTPNLLVHYLVKSSIIYWPTLLA